MKKTIAQLLLIASILGASIQFASAAVAFDTFSNGGTDTAGASICWNHTTSGSDRALVVIGFENSAVIPTATYNGVSMTKINDSDGRIGFFWLANPALGTNQVCVNFGGGGITKAAVAASYTGVSATGNPEANALASNGGGSLASSVTTLTDNAWVIGASRSEDGGVSAGAGTTLRGNGTAAGGYTVRIFDSGGPVTPAGSKTLNMTTSGGGFNNDFFVASFKPAVAATVTGSVSTFDDF